ncbi:MAG TPA: hypothetical protein VF323_09180 [Candidatus Limnocylindrales bacterium]
MRSPTSPIPSASRASRIFLTAFLVPAFVVAGCAVGATSVPPTPTPTTSPVAIESPLPSTATVPPSASPSPSPTTAPTPTPTTPPTPKPAPTVRPSTPAACATSIAIGLAPSDRLTKVTVASGATLDRITFTFGTSSGQPSGTKPTRELRPTSPPFSLAGSGRAVTVAGHRFFAVTFRGMAIMDAQGNPTYTGPNDIHANAPAVRELRLVDDFEGVVQWIVGVNGRGCVAVTRLTAPTRIVVSVTQL